MMLRVRITFLWALGIFLSVFFFSCNRKPEIQIPVKEFEQFNKMEKANGHQKIAPINSFLAQPTEILKIDTFLIVLDRKLEKVINIFGSKSFNFLGSAGVKGRGPGELVGAWQLSNHFSKNHEFWVFDISTQKAAMFNLDSILAKPNYTPNKIIDLPLEIRSANNICQINDSLFASVGWSKEGRINFFSSGGKYVNSVGRYKDYLDVNENEFVLADLLESYLHINPNKKNALVINRNFDGIEYYDSLFQLKLKVTESNEIRPLYKTNGSRNIILEENVEGYVDVQSDNEYIYALYSGIMKKKENSVSGDKIRVFTWEGEPVIQIDLGVRLIDFVFLDNNKIVGLDIESGTFVLVDIEGKI
jgi:hypothetical protein